MVSSRLVFSRFLWPVTDLVMPCGYWCAAPVPGRKRARPTTPSVREHSRNWTNFELLAVKAHAQSQSSTHQRFAIAAGRPDIGTGARPCYQMDGRASINRMHPERALNKHSLQNCCRQDLAKPGTLPLLNALRSAASFALQPS
jgi:hypothetical protein